ncbi:hypothetical protein ACFVYP_40840 [Kitasatospora sp. NPDC058201]|uniref:hypothetical protein n=1 Tax=Streptomycetaceae TaxID=2062 RepID=UPI002E784609|nr:hypothetical protein [Streptomyces sp. BE303]MED7947599.1 hypothetical protein [Streptomyces sp. BE303]
MTSRTRRAPARRVLAVCALTGAALLTTFTGGQAWADGSPAPAPATPTAAAPAAPHAPVTPTVVPPGAPAPGTTPTAVPSAKAGSDGPAVPRVTPTHPPTTGAVGGPPQVREVPKGAAQAGDGSGSTGSSGLMLAGGGTVAAVGAAALGFALLRRRSGARG